MSHFVGMQANWINQQSLEDRRRGRAPQKEQELSENEEERHDYPAEDFQQLSAAFSASAFFGEDSPRQAESAGNKVSSEYSTKEHTTSATARGRQVINLQPIDDGDSINPSGRDGINQEPNSTSQVDSGSSTNEISKVSQAPTKVFRYELELSAFASTAVPPTQTGSLSHMSINAASIPSMDSRLDFLLAEARRLHKARKYDQALLLYNDCELLQPGNLQVLTGRAKLFSDTGERHNALVNLSKALSYHPDCLATRTNRGLLHHRMGMSHLALADFQHALEIDDEFIPALGARGDMYYDLGEWHNALQDYQTVLRHTSATNPLRVTIESRVTDLKAKIETGATIDRQPKLLNALSTAILPATSSRSSIKSKSKQQSSTKGYTDSASPVISPTPSLSRMERTASLGSLPDQTPAGFQGGLRAHSGSFSTARSLPQTPEVPHQSATPDLRPSRPQFGLSVIAAPQSTQPPPPRPLLSTAPIMPEKARSEEFGSRPGFASAGLDQSGRLLNSDSPALGHQRPASPMTLQQMNRLGNAPLGTSFDSVGGYSDAQSPVMVARGYGASHKDAGLASAASESRSGGGGDSDVSQKSKKGIVGKVLRRMSFKD